MNEYTASNGVTVTRYESERLPYRAGLVPLTQKEFDALREFFRAEEDERLGRWRWPALPEYVAYWHPALQRLTVTWDPEGGSTFFKRDDDLTYAGNPGKVARAYFDAHPEPKAWHEAKRGDVWALTCKGVEEIWYVRKNHFRDVDGLGIKMPLDNTLITAGRRIWPES